MLESIYLWKNFKAARVSSFDRSGGNNDSIKLEPGETRVIAEIEGPGIISHIWLTSFGKWGPDDTRDFDSLTLRKMVIRIFWDDEEDPSVQAPIGDFFGLGHARAYSYQSVFFSAACNRPIEGTESPRVAMNSWIPMPFRKKARIELVNELEKQSITYFYIDYQKHEELPEEAMYLHANWRRCLRNPIVRAENGRNLSDKDNYLILEAEGRGTYVGVNMSIDNIEGGWWGEGDDMIFVDRDDPGEWPPDLHGTGTEDYFCHAWGMQKAAHLYCGQPWSEVDDGGNGHHNAGKVCVYRYHAVDPVPFEKNIRVSIEHGHANDRGDDWSSTAYWYQTEPHRPFESMPPAEQRVPGPSQIKESP
ncbi:MAG: glycoside hydrolase family 172 protein [Clostridia bacterium]